MFSRFVFACFLLVSIAFCGTPAFAGKTELTTYYPAPYGEYKNLKSTEDAYFATTSGSVRIGTENPTSCSLNVHNSLSQGSACISGDGDGNLTYSALYLLAGTVDATAAVTNSWVLGHKKMIGTVEQDDLHVVRWIGSGLSRVDLVIDSVTGNVGIGPLLAPAYKLDISGQVRATSFSPVSDERFKKNIEPLSGSLEKIEQLQGVSFEWRTEEFPYKGFEKGKQVGLIAQAVEKVIPELVLTDDQGYKSLFYDKMTAVLVEAVKEQQRQIDLLKKEVAELQK